MRAFALLLAAGVLAYANGLGNPFIWDDYSLVIDNPAVRSPQALPAALLRPLYQDTGDAGSFYRPLQTLSLAADHAVWGLHPFGYHLTNLLLHLLCGIAGFLALQSVTGRRAIAFWAALLFLVHPANGTVVNYVSSRADALAALFSLCSIACFFTGRRACALAAFGLALLSKESAATLPLLVLALCWAVGKPLRGALPFFGMLAAYAAARLLLLGLPPALPEAPAEVRLLTGAKAFIQLALLLLWPSQTGPEKPFAPAAGWGDWEGAAALALTAAAAWAAFRLRRRLPAVSAGLAWFCAGLLPLTLLPLNALIADHWLYLPSLGFFAAALAAAAGFAGRRPLRRFAPACLAAAALALGARSAGENRLWSDPVRFFERIVERNPDSAPAHNELGMLAMRRRETDRAIVHFQRAIEADPAFAWGYGNLAAAFGANGAYAEAVAWCRAGLKIRPDSPFLYLNLGTALHASGRLEEAVAAYEQAVRLQSDYSLAHNNLAYAYQALGQPEKAAAAWRRAGVR